jgi:hypothetical protein
MVFLMLGIAYTFHASAPQTFAQVPPQARQLITAVAPAWDSHRAVLHCWERRGPNAPWQPVANSGWPVLLGRNGMAWGRGVFRPTRPDIPWKVEKDGKAPAGIFELGRIYGEQPQLPQGAVWPYLQIGRWDAWVDNPKLPHYNQHIRVDPNNVPPWFESQRMRLGDNAYKWLVEIRHNSQPTAPGYGSAIFFHVRRGPDRPSSGCTTMEVNNLEKLIRWIRVEKQPYYVLLPREEYEQLRAAWNLP